MSLPGAEPYATVESLPHRFLSTGFTSAHALTLKDIRRLYTDPDELMRYVTYLSACNIGLNLEIYRIARLEMLDEIEELELVLQHYAISWGLLSSNPAVTGETWSQWGLKLRMSGMDSNPDA